MEDKYKKVIKELTSLSPIKEEVFLLEVLKDEDDNIIGVGINENKEGISIEAIWVEVVERRLTVKVTPEAESMVENRQELWTVLYCLSSILRKECEETWGDMSTSEIAEELYEGRLDIYGEAFSGVTEGSLELKKVTLKLDIEDTTELIMSHEDHEIITIVNFINTLAEISGSELNISVLGTEGEEILYGETEGTLKDIKEEVGILESGYVNHNISILIDSLLAGKDIRKYKDILTFLNQIVYERVQIDSFLEGLISGEEYDGE